MGEGFERGKVMIKIIMVVGLCLMCFGVGGFFIGVRTERNKNIILYRVTVVSPVSSGTTPLTITLPNNAGEFTFEVPARREKTE